MKPQKVIPFLIPWLSHQQDVVVGQKIGCLFGDGCSTVVFLEGVLGVHKGEPHAF